MKEQAGEHTLTLMTRTNREMIYHEQPKRAHLLCPECHHEDNVDPAFLKRGDYYCDGSGDAHFIPRLPGLPVITEIFAQEGKVSGDALSSLRRIGVLSKELFENIEAWIYMYGVDDDY